MEGNKGVILLAESWFYYLALSLDSLSHIQLKSNLFGLELAKFEHTILAISLKVQDGDAWCLETGQGQKAKKILKLPLFD